MQTFVFKGISPECNFLENLGCLPRLKAACVFAAGAVQCVQTDNHLIILIFYGAINWCVSERLHQCYLICQCCLKICLLCALCEHNKCRNADFYSAFILIHHLIYMP